MVTDIDLCHLDILRKAFMMFTLVMLSGNPKQGSSNMLPSSPPLRAFYDAAEGLVRFLNLMKKTVAEGRCRGTSAVSQGLSMMLRSRPLLSCEH